jgi:hypothetical protein
MKGRQPRNVAVIAAWSLQPMRAHCADAGFRPQTQTTSTDAHRQQTVLAEGSRI